ncbi:uncharacterized protein LOC131436396 [Malaya genurostris]|uniref:uncharacterized protein LOC131436396 n=1 Tax=Malaya genurostris TaxID=325434 RepID=UPI0026F3F232|nr:uncharacterized protein LOC131436396 [Malaya genurostris]
MKMKTTLIKATVLCSLAVFVTGEIIVASDARLALKKRSIDLEVVRWCDIFYQEDFPPNTACEGKEDNIWDYFPTCCNGAYNCRSGTIWDVYLCAPQFIYDVIMKTCIKFEGNICPYYETGGNSTILTTTTSVPTRTNSPTTIMDDFESTSPETTESIKKTTTNSPETTTITQINCNNVVNGKMAHPTDCTKYIVCNNEKPTIHDCLKEYIYYVPFSVCLPGNTISCKLHSVSEK